MTRLVDVPPPARAVRDAIRPLTQARDSLPGLVVPQASALPENAEPAVERCSVRTESASDDPVAGLPVFGPDEIHSAPEAGWVLDATAVEDADLLAAAVSAATWLGAVAIRTSDPVVAARAAVVAAEILRARRDRGPEGLP